MGFTGVTTLQGAATATGNGSKLNVSDMAAVVFQVAGTFSATVTFEGTLDDSNWVALYTTKVSDGSQSTTTTAAGLFRASTAGLKYVRARVTWTSGTSVTVVAQSSNAPFSSGSGSGGSETGTYAGNKVIQGSLTADSLILDSTNADVTLARLAAASARFGAAASATPLAYNLQVGESARGGTDTNVAGASGTVSSGIGTGTGAASSLVFQTPTVGSTGTTAQTLATRLTVATAGIYAAGSLYFNMATPASNVTGFQVVSSTRFQVILNNSALLQLGDGVAQLLASGSFSWAPSTDPTATGDLYLRRDAANILAQRNGVNAQVFNIYNTYTDTSNYEIGFIRWSSNVFTIGTSYNGTGTNRSIAFVGGGTNRWNIDISGHFVAATDNTYDIGASGATRPRHLYLAGVAVLGGVPRFNGTNTTGAGSALLGANSPASTLTAPYTWIQVTTSDGSTAYIPCWK